MKPMLAATVEDIHSLNYPLYGSPKYDGIRALVQGSILSRRFKEIPNRFIQSKYSGLLEGLDGELIAGDPTAKDCFQRSTSAIMSQAGEPGHVKFYVFDDFSDPHQIFRERYKLVQAWEHHPFVIPVKQEIIHSSKDLIRYEEKILSRGYEGVMLRRPDGIYKYGRSTLNEAYLMKLKPFDDAEAVVIGFIEQMKNTNEAKRNALGKLERSNHKAGMVPKNTLGALVVTGLNGEFTGVTFQVGTGFDDATKKEIWTNQSQYMGKLLKYKYLKMGSKDAPRHPVFLGWRID